MTTTTLTIKELLKLANLTASQLANQMGLEYGQVSTAVSMDSKGQVPKRPSVRDRQVEIRQYLEDSMAIEEGASSKRSANRYSSPAAAEKYMKHPAGADVSYEFRSFKLGDYIRLDPDNSGTVGLYRFVRLVTPHDEQREPYIDVFGGESGGSRSVRVSKVLM